MVSLDAFSGYKYRMTILLPQGERMRKQMPAASCYKFSRTFSRFFCKVQRTCASFSYYYALLNIESNISFGLGRASVIAQFIIKCKTVCEDDCESDFPRFPSICEMKTKK